MGKSKSGDSLGSRPPRPPVRARFNYALSANIRKTGKALGLGLSITWGRPSLGPRPFSGGREKRSGRSSRGHADLRNVNISISAHISDHFPHSTRYPRHDMQFPHTQRVAYMQINKQLASWSQCKPRVSEKHSRP